jgi:hypothetical protein
MIQKTDGDGNPVFEADGVTPVMVQKTEMVQDKDSDGNLLWEDEDKTIPTMVEMPVFKDEIVGIDYNPVELSNIVSIAAGANTSAAVTADGKVYVWGDNRNYEAAAGDRDYVYESEGQEKHLVAKGNRGSVVRPTLMTGGVDNTISERYAWSEADQLFKSVNKGAEHTDVAFVSLGGNHGLLATKDGALYAWGLNQHGQAGVGADPDTAADIGSTGSISTVGPVDSDYPPWWPRARPGTPPPSMGSRVSPLWMPAGITAWRCGTMALYLLGAPTRITVWVLPLSMRTP